MSVHPLSGIYAAALTPLTASGAPDSGALPRYLDFLAERGCHGALLLGTTGEGPSFSGAERRAIWSAAAEWRQARPGFRLLAGTGTPSLTETTEFTQTAFDLGYEAAVVLPPYYFRNASQEGLFDWFAQLIESAVPAGKWLLGYHIPQVSGVALPPKLLARLAAAYPQRFGGLKDSSGDPAQAAAYIDALPGCAVLVGNDQLLADAMQGGAAGAITAGATLWSPLLRRIYDGAAAAQDQVDPLRSAMDAHPPAPAFLKAMLGHFHDLKLGSVRAPLLDFDPEHTQTAIHALEAAGYR